MDIAGGNLVKPGLRVAGESFKIFGQAASLLAAVYAGRLFFNSAARGFSALPEVLAPKRPVVVQPAAQAQGQVPGEGAAPVVPPGQDQGGVCGTCGRTAYGEEPVSWTSVQQAGWTLVKCAGVLTVGVVVKAAGVWISSDKVINNVVSVTQVNTSAL